MPTTKVTFRVEVLTLVRTPDTNLLSFVYISPFQIRQLRNLCKSFANFPLRILELGLPNAWL